MQPRRGSATRRELPAAARLPGGHGVLGAGGRPDRGARPRAPVRRGLSDVGDAERNSDDSSEDDPSYRGRLARALLGFRT